MKKQKCYMPVRIFFHLLCSAISRNNCNCVAWQTDITYGSVYIVFQLDKPNKYRQVTILNDKRA